MPPKSPKRVVKGLLWATPGTPSYQLPPAPTSGARARGLRYEKALANRVKTLHPTSWHNPWFQFCDSGGLGWCQPDVVIYQEPDIFVLEAKLTDCEDGRKELEGLYLPVFRQFYGPAVWGLTVSKFLTTKSPEDRIVTTLKAALKVASQGSMPILHWNGRHDLG